MSQPDPPLSPRALLRWAVVRRVVEDLAPADVLELGCGLGAVGVRLARSVPSYTAAEPDDACWQVAHDRITPLGGRVLHGDHNKVPDGAVHDLVCAFEVLEHIDDDAAALADWLPLVRPGGHLLLSVPADPERFGPSDEAVGHYRRYTAPELGRRLVEAGCVDVRVRHYAWPLGYVLDDVRDLLVRRRGVHEAGAHEAGGHRSGHEVGRTGPGHDLAAGRLSAETAAERTAGSGRLFQPRTGLLGTVLRVGVAPFATLQDTRPRRGPGLIAVARRPAR